MGNQISTLLGPEGSGPGPMERERGHLDQVAKSLVKKPDTSDRFTGSQWSPCGCGFDLPWPVAWAGEESSLGPPVPWEPGHVWAALTEYPGCLNLQDIAATDHLLRPGRNGLLGFFLTPPFSLQTTLMSPSDQLHCETGYQCTAGETEVPEG